MTEETVESILAETRETWRNTTDHVERTCTVLRILRLWRPVKRSWPQQSHRLHPKPKEKNIVDCKRVFRIIRDDNGNIERYKARLVAKGYS